MGSSSKYKSISVLTDRKERTEVRGHKVIIRFSLDTKEDHTNVKVKNINLVTRKVSNKTTVPSSNYKSNL